MANAKPLKLDPVPAEQPAPVEAPAVEEGRPVVFSASDNAAELSTVTRRPKRVVDIGSGATRTDW